MKRSPRVLLPKPQSREAQRDAQSYNAGEAAGSRPLKERRAAVKIACDRCRQRKIRCNGQQPRCATCIELKADCRYEQAGVRVGKAQLEKLRSDLRARDDIFDYLRSVPEEEALSFIRRLKTTQNVGELLSSTGRSKPLNHQPSSHQCARALLPPTLFSVEYELTMRHKLVYPVLEPMEQPNMDLKSLDRSSLSKLSGSVTHAVFDKFDALSGDSEGLKTIAPPMLFANPPTPPGEQVAERRSPVTGPPQPSRWCDPRLNRLNIGFWTNVPISNDFAACAISTYLETDHALLGFFDADLFLSDLVEQRFSYCSPFLVSSLLYLACLCYTGTDERASTLSHIFQHDAERLWPAYRGSDTVTTLSAMLMFSMACNWLGKDELGQSLLTAARAMAERMQLFGSTITRAMVMKFMKMTPERIRATSHAAWGCYSYLTFHASMYGGEAITHPPALPLPGDENREVDNETQWPAHPLPGYMGRTFTVLCRLWSTVQEVIALYNIPHDVALAAKIPLSFAEEKYQTLLSWADMWAETSTNELVRNGLSQLHVYIFHAMFHVAVLNIFRPFLATEGRSRLGSFSSSDSCPIAIVNASFQQLKRLLLEAIGRPSYKTQSGLLNPAVMHISNIILAHSDPQSWRSLFFLCMRYWIDATPSFPVLADIAQGYLSLALKNGSFSTHEARTIKRTLAQMRASHGAHELSSSVIVDFDSAITQSGAYRAYELAQQFEELATFDDITTGNE